MRSPPHLHIAKPSAGEGTLTAMQQRFVDHYGTGQHTLEQAAILAGYSPDSASQSAQRLQHNPLIQQQISKALVSKLAFSAVKALSVIERLSESARSDYVKLAAAQDLLDRAGYKPPERTDLRLDANLTVSLQLRHEGGSRKGAVNETVTLPHTREIPPEDVPPDE
jgi:phage terminase small subunit